MQPSTTGATPPLSTPSPTGTEDNNANFVSAAYHSLASDPAKLACLVNIVHVHQLTEQISTSFGTGWVVADASGGTTQLIRIDKGRTSGATSARERLRGTYRVKSKAQEEEANANSSSSTAGSGDTTPQHTAGAAIVEINDDSKRKRKNNKKKKAKKVAGAGALAGSPEEEGEELEIELGRTPVKELGDKADADSDVPYNAIPESGQPISQTEDSSLSNTEKPQSTPAPTPHPIITGPPEYLVHPITMPSFGQVLDPTVPAFVFGSIHPSEQSQSQSQSLSHTRNSCASDDESIHRPFDHFFGPPLGDSDDSPSHHSQIPTAESIMVSAPTPPESPLVEQGILLPNAIVKSFDPNQGNRPPTPPPDAPSPETQPQAQPQPHPHIAPVTTAGPGPPHSSGPTIPSITFANPTTPPAIAHPMSHGWTMFFSDTGTGAHSRQLRKSLSPLNPNPNPSASTSTAAAADYSSYLVTLFSADTLEDHFGSWKALRRAIAESKRRTIEPLGDSALTGGAGLGTHLFAEDSNFHLFVRGIRPMWEDPMCKHGGKIMIAGDALVMDNLFLEITLLLISGELETTCPSPLPYPHNFPLGTVLSRRKLTRIELWLGGERAPDQGWTREVVRFLERRFVGAKVYGYKAFGKA